jgi:hypothetical protein
VRRGASTRPITDVRGRPRPGLLRPELRAHLVPLSAPPYRGVNFDRCQGVNLRPGLDISARAGGSRSEPERESDLVSLDDVRAASTRRSALDIAAAPEYKWNEPSRGIDESGRRDLAVFMTLATTSCRFTSESGWPSLSGSSARIALSFRASPRTRAMPGKTPCVRDVSLPRSTESPILRTCSNRPGLLLADSWPFESGALR